METSRVSFHFCFGRNARDDAHELESERHHESDASEDVQGEKQFAADFGGRQEVGAEVHMSSLQNDDQSKNEDGVHVEKPSDWSHGSLQEST